MAEATPGGGESSEGSGSGFYNRRLHNYPLIKVGRLDRLGSLFAWYWVTPLYHCRNQVSLAPGFLLRGLGMELESSAIAD